MNGVPNCTPIISMTGLDQDIELNFKRNFLIRHKLHSERVCNRRLLSSTYLWNRRRNDRAEVVGDSDCHSFLLAAFFFFLFFSSLPPSSICGALFKRDKRTVVSTLSSSGDELSHFFFFLPGRCGFVSDSGEWCGAGGGGLDFFFPAVLFDFVSFFFLLGEEASSSQQFSRPIVTSIDRGQPRAVT